MTQSWQQLKRWAIANDQDLSLELDAATAAEMTNTLLAANADLHADEPLVFGRVEPKEVRLWMLCCDWVQGGNTRLDPGKTPLLKMERRAAELMDTCLRLNVNHPDQIEGEMKKRRGIWDGYAGAIVQDSRGRWFSGMAPLRFHKPAVGLPGSDQGLAACLMTLNGMHCGMKSAVVLNNRENK